MRLVDHGATTPSRDASYAAAVRRLVSAMAADVEATTELEVVAALLVEAASELVDAECVITIVPPDQHEVFRVVGGGGKLAKTLVGSEWTVAGTLNWKAMSESTVVETTSAQAISSGLPPVFAAAGVNSARLVPLQTGQPLPDGRVGLGVLSFWRIGDAPFTDDERAQMDDLAELASMFIRRLELGRAARKVAEEEADKLREHATRMAGLEEVKTEFLNLASHELRGPLAVVQGYVSMMEEGALKGRQLRAVLPTVSAKLRQINLLVNEMLETARLEDHRLHLSLMDVDVGALVERLVASVRMASDPGHTVKLELPADPVVVRADPTRLETIVANLVDNAIKYSPEGGRVEVTISMQEGVGCVRVDDQGLGIAEADFPRLFTRFGRLVTSENSHIAGTGLGLYLSRQLARMHGGDIAASSDPGRGSSFTVSIPLA